MQTDVVSVECISALDEDQDFSGSEEESTEDDEELTAEQKLVMEYVSEGYNVFMTGPGGTGKSRVIHAIVRRERAKGREVAITAPTGVAAVNVDGITLHSFLKQDHPVDLLIIDEISMVAPDFFVKEVMNESMSPETTAPGADEDEPKKLWKQLLLVGDFLQLPPVSKEDKQVQPHNKRQRTTIKPTFVFETRQWQRIVQKTVMLTRVHRQGNDSLFCDLLQRVRLGQCSTFDQRALRGRVNVELLTSTTPLRLYATNSQVDRVNSQELHALGDVEQHSYAKITQCTLEELNFLNPGKLMAELLSKPVFEQKRIMNDFLRPSGKLLGAELAKLYQTKLNDAKKLPLRQYIVQYACITKEWCTRALELEEDKLVASGGPELVLKVGARVMLQKNLDVKARLANGTIGIVSRFEPVSERWIATCRCCHVVGERFFSRKKQKTVYKCTECDKWFKQDEEWREDDETLYPVVDFEDENGKFSNTQLIWQRVDVRKTRIEGVGSVGLQQLPLTLAWAVTIHKAQGVSTCFAEMDLGSSVFSPAQAYVALSRVRTLSGVRLTKFDPVCIRAHPKAIEFYRALASGAVTTSAHVENPNNAAPLNVTENVDASEQKCASNIIGFGKYSKLTIEEVASKDMSYLRWCIGLANPVPALQRVLPEIRRVCSASDGVAEDEAGVFFTNE